jgi:hypothetical protein
MSGFGSFVTHTVDAKQRSTIRRDSTQSNDTSVIDDELLHQRVSGEPPCPSNLDATGAVSAHSTVVLLVGDGFKDDSRTRPAVASVARNCY